MRRILTTLSLTLLVACGTETAPEREAVDTTTATESTEVEPSSPDMTQVAAALRAALVAQPLNVGIEYETPGSAINLKVDEKGDYELISTNDGAIIHTGGEVYIKTDGVVGLENVWIHIGPDTDGDFNPTTVVNDTIRDATGVDLDACLESAGELTGAGDNWELACDGVDLNVRLDAGQLAALTVESTTITFDYAPQQVAAPGNYLTGQKAADALGLLLEETVKTQLTATAEAYRRTAAAITATDPSVTGDKLLEMLVNEGIGGPFNVTTEGPLLRISSEKCSITVDFTTNEGTPGEATCK